MSELKKAYAPLFNEINPRRLAMHEFTKVFLHQSEWEKIIDRMHEGWNRHRWAMSDLHKDSGFQMCKGYFDHSRAIEAAAKDHIDHFKGYVTYAEAHFAKTKNAGVTSGDHKITPIKAAWDFNGEVAKAYATQMDCWLANGGDQATYDDMNNKAALLLTRKSEYRSLDCYLRFVHNRVRWWEMITDADSQAMIDGSNQAWDEMVAIRATLIDGKDHKDRQINTEAVGILSEAKLEEMHEMHEEVLDFIEKWRECDDSLYDNTMKVTKRLNMAKSIRTKALHISYWIYDMQMAGKKAHPKKKESQTWEEPGWW